MGILDKFRLDGKLALVTGSATGLDPPSLSRWPRRERRSHAMAIAALRRKRAKGFVPCATHHEVLLPTLASRTARTRCMKRCWEQWAYRMSW